MKIVISEKYRTPSQQERRLGLWVDRIGSASKSHEKLDDLRVLNLYAVVAVVNGGGIFTSPATGEFALAQGDAVLLFPAEPTAYGAVSGSWDTSWIVWDGSDAEGMISCNCFNPREPLVKNGAGCVLQAYSKIERLMGHEDIASIMERRLILHEMLLELYQLQNHEEAGRNRQLTTMTAKFVENNLSGVFDIAELAAYCGFSETHYRRLFKEITGSTPLEYITSKRISEAKKMLRQGIAVKDISDRLGFSSEFYFRRVFRERTGVTPGKFC